MPNCKDNQELLHILNKIVEKAIERNTGARGLRAIIEDIMRDIMYEVPSNPNIETCIITRDVVENKAEPKLVLRKVERIKKQAI